MAFPRPLTYSTVLTFLAFFISCVTATPIQNDEHREDAGVAGFPLHTVHLIPDAGPLSGHITETMDLMVLSKLVRTLRLQDFRFILCT
jgi:hypothetical protein